MFLCHVLLVFSSLIDSEEKPVQLITTLDNSEVDLLTLEYIKVCTIPYTLIGHFFSDLLVYSCSTNCHFSQMVKAFFLLSIVCFI